jgi:hypothetical protein
MPNRLPLLAFLLLPTGCFAISACTAAPAGQGQGALAAGPSPVVVTAAPDLAGTLSVLSAAATSTAQAANVAAAATADARALAAALWLAWRGLRWLDRDAHWGNWEIPK